jgi:hypothetical protein
LIAEVIAALREAVRRFSPSKFKKDAKIAARRVVSLLRKAGNLGAGEEPEFLNIASEANIQIQ